MTKFYIMYTLERGILARNIVVWPPNHLALKGSERQTKLPLAHDLLACVLMNISFQLLDLREDNLRAVIIL